MKKLTLALLALGLVLGGCDRDSVMGPTPPDLTVARAGSPALNVVTYNVFWGARVEDLLLVEDPLEIPVAVAQIWGQVQATNFAERADAIAAKIATAKAHVVGLQEIALYRYQSPADFAQPATDTVLDFLDILIDALDARGLSYTAASMTANFDIELPIIDFGTGSLDEIRLTDFDVVLVRDDVAWSNAAAGNFAAPLPIPLPDGSIIYKPSGWASVDITFKNLAYRFVNTHLEPADVGPNGEVNPDLAFLQSLQLQELLFIVNQSPYPVIMVGDFNSDDDGSTTATYQTVRDEGFVDAWLIGPQRGAGYTSNQAPDLLNATSQLFHRIDFVFYRDKFTKETGQFQGSVKAQVIGGTQGDRTPSGLWPSDHAGVWAALTIAPGLGHPE